MADDEIAAPGATRDVGDRLKRTRQFHPPDRPPGPGTLGLYPPSPSGVVRVPTSAPCPLCLEPLVQMVHPSAEGCFSRVAWVSGPTEPTTDPGLMVTPVVVSPIPIHARVFKCLACDVRFVSLQEEP